MAISDICGYGTKIKKCLIESNKEQNWLIDEVRSSTGLYFDSSYLHKIMTGKIKTPKIIAAINEALGIEYPDEAEKVDHQSDKAG